MIARHNELIWQLMTLKNHDLIGRLMAIMRWLIKYEKGKILSPTETWTKGLWGWKPMCCYQWAMSPNLLCDVLPGIKQTQAKVLQSCKKCPNPMTSSTPIAMKRDWKTARLPRTLEWTVSDMWTPLIKQQFKNLFNKIFEV